MPSKARTVDEYLEALPPDRREALEAVRRVILENLDGGYAEGMQYGMIGYFVPHEVYPAGYHCDPKQPLPFASLASQKNHMALYLMCIYGAPEHEAWFRKAWKATGKKLDMGKSCVRFKRLDDVALEVVGEAIRRVPTRDFLAHYENTLAASPGRRLRNKAGTKKKSTAKKPAAKKSAAKKGASGKTTRRKKSG